MDKHNNGTEKFSRLFPLAFVLASFMGYSAAAQAENSGLAPKYRKIIPGVSTRADVERIFPATNSRKFADEYRIDFYAGELSIGIKYSTGTCGSYYSTPDWGKFPKWTVVDVWYTWRMDDHIPLKKVIFDRRQFAKTKTGDVTTHDTYINEEEGVEVIYDTKAKRVIDIFLVPAAKFKTKYSC